MQWSKRLQSFNEWLVYLMLFAIPLVFSERFFLAYELPKLVIFRVAVLFLFFGTLAKVFAEGEMRILKVFEGARLKKILLAIFFTIFLITALAVAPELSFWGSYFRGHGSYTLLHYLAFFILLAMNFQSRAQWEKALMFSAASFFLVGAYATLQYFGLDFTSYNLQEVSLGRSYSSLGQPNYLASYLLLMLPVLFVYFYVKGRYFLATAALMVAAFALGASESRSGVLGLTFALFFMLTLWHFFVKKQRGFWLIIVLSAVAGSTFLFGISQDDPFRSVLSRLVIWDTSIELVKDSPLVGYGPDSLSTIFPSYTDGSLLATERSNTIPGRTHNNILELLISGGLLALAVFFWAFGWVLKRSFAGLKNLKGDERIYLIGALSGVCGMFVAHLFAFSMTVHFSYLAFLLAFMMFLFSEGKTVKEKVKLRPAFKAVILGAFAFFVIGSTLLYNVFFLVSDNQLKNAYGNIQLGHSVLAEQNLIHAVNYYPYQSYSYYLLSSVEAVLGNEEAATWAAMQGLDFTNGRDGQAYFLLAEATEDFDAAEAYYLQAAELMPYSPRLFLNWGQFYIENGECDAGVNVLSSYVKMLPDHWKHPDTEAYRLFYKHNPDFDKALDTMSSCLEELPDF